MSRSPSVRVRPGQSDRVSRRCGGGRRPGIEIGAKGASRDAGQRLDRKDVFGGETVPGAGGGRGQVERTRQGIGASHHPDGFLQNRVPVHSTDRKRVVEGKSVSVRVDLGVRQRNKKKTEKSQIY